MEQDPIARQGRPLCATDSGRVQVPPYARTVGRFGTSGARERPSLISGRVPERRHVVRPLMYGTIWQRDDVHCGICVFRLIASAVSPVEGQRVYRSEDHPSIFARKNVEEHRQRFGREPPIGSEPK